MLINGKVVLDTKSYYEIVLAKLQKQAAAQNKDQAWIDRELEIHGLA